MRATNWSDPTDHDTVCRRAAGRRAYNSRRRFLRIFRRKQVAELVGRYGFDRGVQSKISRELGVNRCTISRDFEALMRQANEPPTFKEFLRDFVRNTDAFTEA